MSLNCNNSFHSCCRSQKELLPIMDTRLKSEKRPEIGDLTLEQKKIYDWLQNNGWEPFLEKRILLEEISASWVIVAQY